MAAQLAWFLFLLLLLLVLFVLTLWLSSAPRPSGEVTRRGLPVEGEAYASYRSAEAVMLADMGVLAGDDVSLDGGLVASAYTIRMASSTSLS